MIAEVAKMKVKYADARNPESLKCKLLLLLLWRWETGTGNDCIDPIKTEVLRFTILTGTRTKEERRQRNWDFCINPGFPKGYTIY